MLHKFFVYLLLTELNDWLSVYGMSSWAAYNDQEMDYKGKSVITMATLTEAHRQAGSW